MENPEENIQFPPEGTGHAGRFESADIDIEELVNYIRNTPFENRDAILDFLKGKYIHQEESLGQMKNNMTRVFDSGKLIEKLSGDEKISHEELQRRILQYFKAAYDKEKSVMIAGREITIEQGDIKNEPLSRKEPEAQARITIKTLDGREFDLRIFKVTNRNKKFRYEFILKDAESLKEE